MAYLLGPRNSIICLTPHLGPWYAKAAETAGLSNSIVSIRVVSAEANNITTVTKGFCKPLREECLKAVYDAKAEVVILGGGPTAGLNRILENDIPVPLLDGGSCAVQLAEALVKLGLIPPQEGSFSHPKPKSTVGLSAALTRYFAGL